MGRTASLKKAGAWRSNLDISMLFGADVDSFVHRLEEILRQESAIEVASLLITLEALRLLAVESQSSRRHEDFASLDGSSGACVPTKETRVLPQRA